VFHRTPLTEDLEHVRLFDGLSHRQLSTLARLSTTVEVPAGRVIAQQGDTGAEFFMLLDGNVDVLRQGEVIATRGPGAHLGEIALLAARPRMATIVTTTPVRARVASQREFTSMLAAVPELSERLNATMAARLAA
jgi:CRP/FNR family cyclic AMP-dependent transcriptional regulator